MESEKVFRTKTGFCHILPDKLVLTRNGIRGSVAKVTVGNKINRILIIYGIGIIGLLYSSFVNYQKGSTEKSVLLVLLAGFLLFGVIKSMNNSATSVIERKSIQKIVLKKAVPGLTRSHFIVFFEDGNGKTKKRLILLPGSLSNGEDETENAFNLLQSEQLI